MKRLSLLLPLALVVPLLLGWGQTPKRPEIRMASPHSYAQTIERLKSASAEAKFSVVFELDVTARAKEKDLDIAPTMILGVCSAKYAKIVLENDLRAVPNLPCRIAVTERNGKVEVWTMDVTQIADAYTGTQMAETGRAVDSILRAIMVKAVAPAGE